MSRRMGSAARLEASGGALWYRAPALRAARGIVHGVTHASLGNFSLEAGEEPGAVHRRRRALLEAAGLGGARVVTARLGHTARVEIAGDGIGPAGRCDALIAREADLVLAVTVADCVPVFFAEAGGGAFGVAHAGWRGLAAGIVRRAVAALVERFGVRPAGLLVAAGPAVRGPSYEVGPEVAARFPEVFAVPSGDPADGRFQLDLPSCALAQAAAEGVPRENLVDFALDTATHPGHLFSHRRGDRERHWAFIGRKSPSAAVVSSRACARSSSE